MPPSSLPNSYYEASVTRPPPSPPLAGEATCDTCVIGGGWTGASAALELARRGRRVRWLESRVIGWGASGRSGGQIIHDYATHDLDPIAKAGGTTPKALFHLSLAAIDLIHSRAAAHGIACDLRRGYAEAAVKPSHLTAMRHWAEKAARAYAYPHVAVHTASDFREIVSSRAYHGGLTNDIGGHLHPLKYALGLATAATTAGAILHENSPATAVTEHSKNGTAGVTVRTATGAIRCANAIIACNAHLDDLFSPIAPRVMPVGTYIAATEPLGAQAADNLIAARRAVCDSRFVLDYYRASADHRLLFGGRVSYSTHPPRDLRRSLAARMRHVFPQLHDVKFDYVWGGNVGITLNRFPDIGRHGNAIYYAQGFSGHGVALTGLAGKLIADAICGDGEQFDIFHRIRHRPFPGGKTLRMPLLVLAMLYYRLRDLL